MNNAQIKFFIIFFFIASWYATQSQSVSANDILALKFTSQVKQLAQFIDRFNFTETSPESDSRAKNIASLFNIEDSSLIRNPTALAFINHICADSIKLSVYDNDWFAKIKCSFTYKDKITYLTLILHQETVDHYARKWVIEAIIGSLFKDLKYSSDSIFINPMNHEIGFSQLTKAFGQSPLQINNYFAASACNNNLNAFWFQLSIGDLKFQQIESIEYQFYQISGWFFTVSNYNRKNFNAGWLISRLGRTPYPVNTTKEANLYTNE